MPIIIPRDGQLSPPNPPLTQEQKEKIWENIIKNWAQNHPEELKKIMDNMMEVE